MNELIRGRGLAMTTLDELMRFSEMVAKTDLVPTDFKGHPEKCLVGIQFGAELGMSPMQSLQNICVINGRPSIYGDAALALCKASSICDDVIETMEGAGTPNPVAVCIAIRKGREPVTVRFSVSDAKRAGLYGKAGPWTQYPARMLSLRARGWALRNAFPDLLKGLITSEEARDIPVRVTVEQQDQRRIGSDLFVEVEVEVDRSEEQIEPAHIEPSPDAVYPSRGGMTYGGD
jgi:hypothetical protein